jgi:exo-1,4-beta-D-glucosaminidase
VINDRLGHFSGGKAHIRVFDLESREVFTDVKDVDVTPNSATVITTLPAIKGLSSVYFLDLKLVDNGGGLVAENFYWLPAKRDVMNYAATEWFVTPIKEFADLTALNRLPPVTLKVMSSFEPTENEQQVRVTLQNPSDKIAFFVNLDVVGRQSGRAILPIYWDDNCVSLLPGESKTLTATFDPADLQGDEPVVRVDGWNVKGH